MRCLLFMHISIMPVVYAMLRVLRESEYLRRASDPKKFLAEAERLGELDVPASSAGACAGRCPLELVPVTSPLALVHRTYSVDVHDPARDVAKQLRRVQPPERH